VSLDPEKFGDLDTFYSFHYQKVLRAGLVGKAQDRTHKALEKRARPGQRFPRVLEVGAGNGEHFPFVRHEFDEYVESDLREDGRREDTDPRRTFTIADAQDLPFEDNDFDRVVATCLLLHLPMPEMALREWRRVTKPGGQLDLLVPCDPGFLVRLMRWFLTAPAVRRSGFRGYKLFNARDHRNHIGSINELVRWVFRADELRVTRYPLKIPSWNLNAYFIYSIKVTE